MDQQLTAVARRVVEFAGSRNFDAHRIFNHDWLSHLFFHELLVQCPSWKARLWSEYRLWPQESSETVDFWLDATADQPAVAIEIVCDDPADHSRLESAGVWSRIISDALKLSTAIAFHNLGTGYVLLVGELQADRQDTRIAQFPTEAEGQRCRVPTSQLMSSNMDAGFFEEMMHPHQSTPAELDLQLLARSMGPPIGFWLWSVTLPAR